MNFTIGKIPARVSTFEVAGDLTIMECINYAVTKNVLQYTSTDTVYLNGTEVSNLSVVPTSPCVILLDVPSVKGAQIVVKIGEKGKEMIPFACKHGTTVEDVVRHANINVEDIKKIYLNEMTSWLDATINRNSSIVIEMKTKESLTKNNVDMSYLKDRLEEYMQKVRDKISYIQDEVDELTEIVNDVEESMCLHMDNK